MKLVSARYFHRSSYNCKVSEHNVVTSKLKHSVVGNSDQIGQDDADKGRYFNSSKDSIKKGVEDNPVHYVKEHHLNNYIRRGSHLHFNQIKAHKPCKPRHKAFDKPGMLVGAS